MRKRVHPFPFSAIVGQEDMKQGLILNIVDPKLGGILAFGEKGTAKSTAVRAIADLLPKIEVVKGCRFRCDPADPSTMCEACREKLAAGEKLETELGACG
jgi:Mg-chelatase subunit ChlI